MLKNCTKIISKNCVKVRKRSKNINFFKKTIDKKLINVIIYVIDSNYFILRRVDMSIIGNNLSELIFRVKNGDTTAFEDILTVYEPLINSSTVKFSRMFPMEAEDIRQEAVIALYNAVCAYEINSEVTFGLYAKICITNSVMSLLRRIKRRDMVESEVLSDSDVSDVSVDSDPEVRTIDRESFTLLTDNICKHLSSFEKSVFDLYMMDMPYREIADSLGCSPKSVDNAISRIKAKIRVFYQ